MCPGERHKVQAFEVLIFALPASVSCTRVAMKTRQSEITGNEIVPDS
jgi:hypothetical protein